MGTIVHLDGRNDLPHGTITGRFTRDIGFLVFGSDAEAELKPVWVLRPRPIRTVEYYRRT